MSFLDLVHVYKFSMCQRKINQRIRFTTCHCSSLHECSIAISDIYYNVVSSELDFKICSFYVCPNGDPTNSDLIPTESINIYLKILSIVPMLHHITFVFISCTQPLSKQLALLCKTQSTTEFPLRVPKETLWF